MTIVAGEAAARPAPVVAPSHERRSVARLGPERDRLHHSLAELWRAHELVYLLTQRELRIRYKQAVLGAGWALLQPLLTMFVFTIFFGRLAHLGSDGVAYPLFTLAALVPWTFFANSVTNASSSLVQNVPMLTKVYFPRLALPLASVFACVVDLAISLVLLFSVMVAYGEPPGVRALAIPGLALIAVLAAAGAGAWLGALGVEYRDFRYIVPFLVQLGLFLTPVAYSAGLVGPGWRALYAANPMVGVVIGFRWALFGTGTNVLASVTVSAASAVVLLITGAAYFNRKAARFADVA